MEARKVSYEHFIIQGVATEEAHRGTKLFLLRGKKLTSGSAYTREQQYAGVFRACPEDPGLGDDVQGLLEQVKTAMAGQPIEWTAERVNPESKGRIS